MPGMDQARRMLEEATSGTRYEFPTDQDQMLQTIVERLKKPEFQEMSKQMEELTTGKPTQDVLTMVSTVLLVSSGIDLEHPIIPLISAQGEQILENLRAVAWTTPMILILAASIVLKISAQPLPGSDGRLEE